MSASSFNWKGFFNFVSFVAVILIGIALILTKLGWFDQIKGALTTIAQVLAYIVVGFYSFFYAYRKMNRARIWYMIAWAVSVVLIVLFYVI